MAQAYVCPDCGTRYSRKPQAERGERCPVCNRQRKQPLVYWRVIGVALGTTTLLLITLIFGLKAWADSRRSAAPPPSIEDKSFLPAIVERQVESAISQPEVKPEPAKKEQPPLVKEETPSEPKDVAKPQAAPAAPPPKLETAKTEIASKPDTQKPAEPAIEKVFKRLDFRSEEELRKELVRVPVFKSTQLPAASMRQLTAATGLAYPKP